MKCFPHAVQTYGFSSVWTVMSCVEKIVFFSFSSNAFLNALQTYGLPPG